MKNGVLIIGHRGASEYETENTMAAFEKAIELNADGVECDVRLTKDKKLAVIHDASVDRTTSEKGKVGEFTLKELNEIGVPSLQDLLSLIKKSGKTVLIEIKEPGTEKKIVELVKKKKIESQSVIVSFFSDSIKLVKKMSRKIRTGYIFSRPTPIDVAVDAKADFLVPRYDLVNGELMRKAQKNNLRIIAWTINDEYFAKQFVSMKVFGIVTNRPDLLG